MFTGGRAHSTFDDHRVDTASYAVFGQLGWAFRPRWNLTLGAHWTYDDRQSRRATSSTVAFTPLLPTPYTVDIGRDWNSFDPLLSLDYTPRDDLLV